MGTAFSSNESVTQSPSRNRPANSVSSNGVYNGRAVNQRVYNPNSSQQRRASTNVPNNFDEGMSYLYCDRSEPSRRHLGSTPTTSQSQQSSQPRPFSFGGELTNIRYTDLDPDERNSIHPARFFYFPYGGQDRKCSICKKMIPFDNFETHYVMCFTKPRVTYNEDVLNEDQGECVICLIDLIRGDIIARLPCLCIYHKKCIEEWFQRSQTCPSHPDFIDPSYSSTAR